MDRAMNYLLIFLICFLVSGILFGLSIRVQTLAFWLLEKKRSGKECDLSKKELIEHEHRN